VAANGKIKFTGMTFTKTASEKIGTLIITVAGDYGDTCTAVIEVANPA